MRHDRDARHLGEAEGLSRPSPLSMRISEVMLISARSTPESAA